MTGGIAAERRPAISAVIMLLGIIPGFILSFGIIIYDILSILFRMVPFFLLSMPLESGIS